MKNEKLLQAAHGIDFVCNDLHASQNEDALYNHVLVDLIKQAVALSDRIRTVNQIVNGDSDE